MKTSGLRRDLMAGAASGTPGQLTIEDAELSEHELDARMAADDAVMEQLRDLARVVVIGYASDPSMIFELGWGDAELDEETGAVTWHPWEPLPLRPSAAATASQSAADKAAGSRSPLGVAPTPAAPAELDQRRPRFDDAPLDDDFRMQPRSPLQGEPQQEASPTPPDTGTEDEQP